MFGSPFFFFFCKMTYMEGKWVGGWVEWVLGINEGVFWEREFHDQEKKMKSKVGLQQ